MSQGKTVDSITHAQFPRIFSLIIGINEYAISFGQVSLKSAEHDAQRWEAFLKTIGGPQSQIVTLLGRSATRQAILQAFDDLAHNISILEGDPIVIFYAGHGGETSHEAPNGEKHMIQMIIPSDYQTGDKICSGISDLEIGARIDNIAQNKGNNITVIMDCCHSVSGTRGSIDNSSSRRVRSIHLPEGAYNLPCADDLVSKRLGSEDRRYWRSGMRSHILLSACRSDEEALEEPDGGIFSTALLRLFQSVPLAQLRYCDILSRLTSMPTHFRQTPQCEGFNKHRFLFKSDLDTTCGHYTRTYTALHEDLLIFIPPDDRLWNIFTNEQLENIKLMDSNSEDAYIRALTTNTNTVIFELVDRRVTKYGLDKPIIWSLDANDPTHIKSVVGAIARYYHELRDWNTDCSADTIGQIIAKDITVEFYKLDDYNEPDWRKFIPEGPNLYRDGIIDFVVEEDAPYGLKLTNSSEQDLYPYLFFFNSGDLSIASLYDMSGSSTGFPIESPLKRNTFLTFGYGSGGVPPYSYRLDGHRINVDFMKIILATSPIDTTTVAQPSPFQIARSSPVPYKPRYPATDSRRSTMIIPFVQRKAHIG